MDLPGISGRSEFCIDWGKAVGRRHSDSGGKGKMVVGDIEENIAKREVYRRCPAAENLYGGFPFQEACQKQWHYAQYYEENRHEKIITRDLYM